MVVVLVVSHSFSFILTTTLLRLELRAPYREERVGVLWLAASLACKIFGLSCFEIGNQ